MIDIKIRPQTAEEAFFYIKNIFKKKKFYVDNGYTVDIPDHSAFSNFFENSNEEFEKKEEELKRIFMEEVYPDLDFSYALADCEKVKPMVSERLEKIATRPGFNLLNSYNVVLTPYGPGGSYDLSGTIVIKINGRRPYEETMVHEAVHIGVEHEVLEKNLDHSEKEKMVEAICRGES